MKVKIGTIELPDEKQLLEGLDLRSVSSELGKAESALHDAEQRFEEVREGLEAVEDEITTLPAAVARDNDALPKLERVVARRESLKLLLPARERVVEEVRRDLVEARKRARARLVDVATERLATLQKTADGLIPVLAHLRDLELAVYDAVKAAHHEPAGPQAAQSRLAALQWPSTVEADAALASWRHQPVAAIAAVK